MNLKVNGNLLILLNKLFINLEFSYIIQFISNILIIFISITDLHLQ
jgi:hypothetical protein